MALIMRNREGKDIIFIKGRVSALFCYAVYNLLLLLLLISGLIRWCYLPTVIF